MTWDKLEQVVSAQVLAAALSTSETLRQLGIPHALVGGLAVGLHGHPRATRDVDFIVGKEAFTSTSPLTLFREELTGLFQHNAIDLLAALPEDPPLAAALQLPQEEGDLPIVSVEVLILMKLRAGRSQDIADIEHLLRAGADIAYTSAWLQQEEPRHLPTFNTIAQRVITAG